MVGFVSAEFLLDKLKTSSGVREIAAWNGIHDGSLAVGDRRLFDNFFASILSAQKVIDGSLHGALARVHQPDVPDQSISLYCLNECSVWVYQHDVLHVIQKRIAITDDWESVLEQAQRDSIGDDVISFILLREI